MQGCDFLDRTPEDIIETGKFFESANANPNELNEINPEYLFNTSSYYTLNAFAEA